MTEQSESLLNESHIIHDPYYEKERAEYSVEVDEGKFRQLLAYLGMSDKGIEDLDLFVSRKSIGDFLRHITGQVKGGQYTSLNNSVTIYTEWAWRGYQKYLGKAQSVAGSAQLPKGDEFSKLLTTKRLARYLKMAPPTRGVRFAEKLILNAINKRLTTDLIHESKHAVEAEQSLETPEDSNFPVRPLMGVVGGAVGAAVPIVISLAAPNEVTSNPFSWVAGAAVGYHLGERIGNKIDPEEQHAREAETKVKMKDYLGLIRLVPKINLL